MTSSWPQQSLDWCAEAGVFKWFIPEQWGGDGYLPTEIADGYLALAESCLTTTFVITQRAAACKRIVATENVPLKQRLLPDLAVGQSFATVGISHLTTSHRHLGRPVLEATAVNGGWKLNGFSPWVTGGVHADHIVFGAEIRAETGDAPKQLLVAVPTSEPGIKCLPGQSLVALSGSHTGRVELQDVMVPHELVLAGPEEQVLKAGKKNAATGRLQTSALAIGLASAAVKFVSQQASQRENLVANEAALQQELADLRSKLLAMADGIMTCSNEELRTAANSFVLRATQSALVAAKGAGFVAEHNVGRWCREALFFLVWSCPQNVSDANLCEFAGIQSA